MKRKIFVKFETVPYSDKGEQQQEIVCRIDRNQDKMIRYEEKAYFPIWCKIHPLTCIERYPLDDELVSWDCKVKEGQFYVRPGDFDRFLRGQSDTARIIRVAQCEEIGWHGESHKWIECDNMGEVGTFYEVKEEGGLDG